MARTRSRNAFPLVPRYRAAGLPLGGAPSLRRGHGSDVAGSRAYVRGDPIATIDWRATARLSTAHGRDEFVVRERYAEEAPRVVVLRDARPSMFLYPPPLPWLRKDAAVDAAVDCILTSAAVANSPLAYLDHAGDEPFWLPPSGRGVAERIDARRAELPRAQPPTDGLARGLAFLGRFRSELGAGTFVFVLSDFLGPSVPDSAWVTAAARRWEVVPVVVQDPTWEQSFPLVGSVVVPLADADTGELLEVRLSRQEARRRRLAHELRHEELRRSFVRTGLDPVFLQSSEPSEVERAFLEWAERRRDLRSRR
jgi:uncharacterized protein (DUF58 family)